MVSLSRRHLLPTYSTAFCRLFSAVILILTICCTQVHTANRPAFIATATKNKNNYNAEEDEEEKEEEEDDNENNDDHNDDDVPRRVRYRLLGRDASLDDNIYQQV